MGQFVPGHNTWDARDSRSTTQPKPLSTCSVLRLALPDRHRTAKLRGVRLRDPGLLTNIAGGYRPAYFIFSILTGVPDVTASNTAASPSILPKTLTGLAGRISAPRLAGVGPQNMQKALPGSQ